MPYRDKEASRRYRAAWYRKNRERLLRYAKKYREDNAEEVAATKSRIYHELYKTDPAFKARMSAYGKQRRRENREHVKAIEKRYRDSHPEVLKEINRRWVRTPNRRARVKVNQAVLTGKLPRASTLQCTVCKKSANVYHHHKGYARKNWLAVKPICYQCHADIHFGSHSR